jgi:hypothetical protein
VGWLPLFPYILETKLHKGGYLFWVTRVITTDSVVIITLRLILSVLSEKSCPRSHQGTADQRPHAYVLLHVPSILDRRVLQGVVDWHCLSVHFASLLLGSGGNLSHPVLKPKPDAHCTCAQEQFATHTNRFVALQNFNAIIEYNCYTNTVLNKRL